MEVDTHLFNKLTERTFVIAPSQHRVIVMVIIIIIIIIIIYWMYVYLRFFSHYIAAADKL